jgi:polysaccharide deacetylase 2 family uncharacterized protein YibQ
MDHKKRLPRWSLLPPAYKKSVYRALGAYAALVACVVLGILVFSGSTLESWNARIPHAYSVIVAEQPVTASSLALAEFVGAPLPPGFKQNIPASGSPYTFSVIVIGLGLNDVMTEAVLRDLPPGVSVAFSPYTSDLEQKSRIAKDQGRDVIALIPMEPMAFPKDDPGPRSLSTSADPATNAFNLKWMVERVSGAKGAINEFGDKFVQDRTRLAAMFTYLREKNLYFVENLETTKSEAAAAARDQSVPYVLSHIKLDDVPTEENIRKKLQEMQAISLQNGHAIAIARPYPITINILKNWIPVMAEKGAKFVPPGNFAAK